MKELAAIVGAVLAIVGNITYLRQIGKGVEPHPYTWALGMLVTAITFAGIVTKGGGVGAWPVAASLVFTTVIFLYSLRFGAKHIRPIDTILLVVALGGLIPWYLLHDPTWSVIIAVGVDLLSFAPTVRKTYLHPHSEAPVLYGANVARHLLVLVALESYVLATMVHSVAMILVNALMVALIVLRQREH